MKKLIYILLIFAAPVFCFAENDDFYYDKEALTNEFNELDKIDSYVDQTNSSYSELSYNPEFAGKVLTNSINLKPTLQFDDMDWGSFAWGFCCWPVGIFTVLINDSKDQNSKNSFWAGFGSITIAYSVGTIALYAYSIAAFGGF